MLEELAEDTDGLGLAVSRAGCIVPPVHLGLKGFEVIERDARNLRDAASSQEAQQISEVIGIGFAGKGSQVPRGHLHSREQGQRLL